MPTPVAKSQRFVTFWYNLPVNVAYFKEMCKNKFNTELTTQELLQIDILSWGDVDVGLFRLDVTQTLGAQVLEMSYKGENVSKFPYLLSPFTF